MSTPEEIERERALLIELSEKTREAVEKAKEMREAQIPFFEDALQRIRETNSSPAMRMLDEVSLARDPDYDPHMVENAIAAFIQRMSLELAASQAAIEATWLGIQESIIALDETGVVPPRRVGTPLLPDLPPRPGPDDVM